MTAKWLIGNEKNSSSSGIFWNSVGGILSAGQSALILLFVTRRAELSASGFLSIAFAIANLFMAMAKYGIRNYQVTDSTHRFSFLDYFYSRIVSSAVSFLLLLLFLAYRQGSGAYTPEKSLVILTVSVLKLLEAVEDVFLGRYQQCGRLDIASRLMTLRLAASTLLICMLLLLGAKLPAAFLAGILLSVVLDLWGIRYIDHSFPLSDRKSSSSSVLRLFRECLPLCISGVLSIYIGNAPKYMIDRYMDETVQAIFAYMMMPVFVIVLLNNFLYQPVIQELGVLWASKEKRRFLMKIRKQCLLLFLLTVAVLFIGGTLGLPVLSVIYHTDLHAYRTEFFLLLLGGSFYAFSYYLTVVLTTIRRQTSITTGYALIVLFYLFCGKQFVFSNGIMGASILYLCSNALLSGIYLFFLFRIQKPATS